MRLIMGGMNIADEYAFGGDPERKAAGASGFRDTDVEVTGPAVKDALTGYLESMRVYSRRAARGLRRQIGLIEQDRDAFAGGPGGAEVRYVNVPRGGPPVRKYIETLWSELIRKTPAGETITLSTAFFLPPRRLVKDMLAAARRGVKFRMLLNAPEVPGREFKVVARAAQSLYRMLLRTAPPGSIDIYSWHGSPGDGVSSIHQKLAAFGDHGPVMVGSSNADAQSLRWNSEGVVLVQGPAVRRAFDAMIARDFARPGVRQVTRAELAAEGLLSKLSAGALRRLLGWIL